MGKNRRRPGGKGGHGWTGGLGRALRPNRGQEVTLTNEPERRVVELPLPQRWLVPVETDDGWVDIPVCCPLNKAVDRAVAFTLGGNTWRYVLDVGTPRSDEQRRGLDESERRRRRATAADGRG